jgi:hypothetical protein
LPKLNRLLKFKTIDLAKLTHKSVEAMEMNQREFFKNLCSSKGWRLKPISIGDFRCFPINEKVVKVERLNGKCLIESLDILSLHGMNSRFSIPLYYSLIGGKWVIIQ